MPMIIVIAIVAYLLTALLSIYYYQSAKIYFSYKYFRNILLSVALLAHTYVFLPSVFNIEGIVFGIVNSSAIIALFIALLVFISSFFKPIYALDVIVYPLNALILLFALFFPESATKLISFKLSGHILLSIAAYGVLALSVCQSILLTVQDNHLHQKRLNAFTYKLPPLETMEKILFNTLVLGGMLLTLSLVSGFVFLENIFAQHLVHKTVLSIIAWFIFAILIFGHKLLGWRGRQLIVFLQIGFIFLILAYFGSKFVLESILKITTS